LVDRTQKEITNPERIKRIIGILRLDGRDIELHLPNYIEIGKIHHTGHESFNVKLSSELIDLSGENPEYIYINFVFSGVELFGKCQFIEQSREYLTLGYPESLSSRTKRRYPRVKLSEELPAWLSLYDFSEIYQAELSPEEIPIEYSRIYWEAKREEVDIKKLLLMIGKELKNISPFTELVIYNEQNKNTHDAYIIRKSGKILFINDCSSVQSYTRFIPSEKIVNYSFLLNESRLRGVSKEETINELKKIINEDRRLGYSSKLIAPIFSKKGVIGHIKVVQKGDKKITPEDVKNIIALSRLLSMGMQKTTFVPRVESAIPGSVVDISEGGVYLKVLNDSAGADIPEGANIEVRFVLKDREITIKGKVCRKNPEEKSYGVKFSDLTDDEREALHNFIEDMLKKRSQKG